MISKQVNFLLDQETGVAICGGNYFVFDGEIPVPVEVKDALALFIEKGVKIPTDFVKIRETLSALL